MRFPSEGTKSWKAFRANGVGCAVYYPKALPDQPALASYASHPCPNAQLLAKQVLSLPLYPELSESEANTVVTRLRETLRG